MEISELLRITLDRDASDLHLAVGRPPVIRVDGRLVNVDAPPLTPADTRRLIYGILTDLQKQKFEEFKELDFSLSVSNLARFRVNVHYQRGTVAAAFRAITSTIRSFEELNLPIRVCEKLSRRPSGLVLITGPTGSGKSTTLAAIVDLINSEQDVHIITVEDPIEYLHAHKRALVEQREVNEDTFSFSNALKYALRQDPDVIFIGELRDHETVMAAIQAAETGHLVFGSMHTADTMQAFSRIIEFFPQSEREFVRSALSNSIQAVCAQRLLPANKDSTGGAGVVPATEVLLANAVVREKIREGEDADLPAVIYSSRHDGMRRASPSLSRRIG